MAECLPGFMKMNLGMVAHTHISTWEAEAGKGKVKRILSHPTTHTHTPVRKSRRRAERSRFVKGIQESRLWLQ